MKTYPILSAVLLHACFSYGQEAQQAADRIWEIGIRHSGSADFYQHPKIGLPGGPFASPFTSWYKVKKGAEHYYNEGAGAIRTGSYFHYRLWVDYYHYCLRANIYFPDTMIVNGYHSFYSGVRLSPGIEKQWRWKFMAFEAGVESSIYWQTKAGYDMVFVPYTPANHVVAQNGTYSSTVSAISFSALASANVHFLKRLSAGLELSNGLSYSRTGKYEQVYNHYNAQGELYKSTVHQYGPSGWSKRPRWFILIPSINFSYHF